MPLPLAPSASPIGMMQRMSAGSKFTGVLPTTAPYVENGLNKYAPGTAGGLFYFQNPRPIVITYFNVDFGASVNYEMSVVSLVNGELVDRTVISSGNIRVLECHNRYGFTLGPHQAIELKVSGSPTAEMIATFWVMDATAYFA